MSKQALTIDEIKAIVANRGYTPVVTIDFPEFIEVASEEEHDDEHDMVVVYQPKQRKLIISEA